MPNTREKIAHLIVSDLPEKYQIANAEAAGKLADHLIDNGVTIQRWIPVSERLPKKFNNTLAVRKCGDWFSVGVECILADGKWSGDVFEKNEVTHWMPLPQPPKEGE